MYSARIESALRAALAAHAGQSRKGNGDVPYAVHPLHVGMLLARWGVDEDVIVAGLLHDVVEDGPDWTLARVEQEFGSHVSSMVAELSEDKSKGWDERKADGIARVARMSPQVASVKAADKLHNLATLTAALAESEDPDAIWSRFKGGREKTLAMSSALVDALCERVEPRIARALRTTLDALYERAGEPGPAGV